MDAAEIWSLILSLGGGFILWIMQNHVKEQKRLEILVNKTREEIAREYVTKVELDRLAGHIDKQFDKLDEKLDKVISGINR